MSAVARSLLPHLVVVAALVDAAIVASLGLHSYAGVLVFAALFVVTMPILYGLVAFIQPDAPTDRETDGV